MCSKLPSPQDVNSLRLCIDIGLLSEVLFTFPNPWRNSYIHLQSDVIYCDISAGSVELPRAAFKL
jgi:hypothetical protein